MYDLWVQYSRSSCMQWNYKSADQNQTMWRLFKVRFIRKISVASNAIQTIDHEMSCPLSVVWIAFDAKEIRRIKRALQKTKDQT